MNLTEKTLRSEEKFRGRILRFKLDEIALPNGEHATREVVEHPGGVCVAALTDEKELLFVRQFRYPYGEVVWELPAGKRDATGEDPLEGAKRELKEETGAEARRFLPLGTMYPTPGYSNEVIWLYAATDLSFGEMQPDEDEFLEVHRVPLHEAVRQVMAGELPDAKTQILVLKINQLVQQGLL